MTVDSTNPSVEAVAMLDGKIAALGTSDEMASWIGSETEVIDLEGRLAIPGLIEGHAHFMGIGQAKMILDLTTVASWQDILDMVAQATDDAEPGEWILGRGWHQEKWEEGSDELIDGVPSNSRMNELSPENPVYLRHASGHAAFANEMAMQLGRVSSETPDPQGGEIVKDRFGNPTGLLRERAQGMVGSAYSEYHDSLSPEEVLAEAEEMAKRAYQELLENGITSFQDAGSGFETIDFLKSLADQGRAPVRLYIMVGGESLDDMKSKITDYRLDGYGGDKITVRSIKTVIDGALGAHGALLLEPYEDMPSTSGLILVKQEEIEAIAAFAAENGFQLNTHAIGDGGNRIVLDVYEEAYDNTESEDLRWRIEHAQHLHPDDIPRFGQLGVIPAMQANHCTSDGPWVAKRLGDKRAEEGAYVWRSLWDTGAVVTNGTDAPVEDVNPFASIYASITRKSADGSVFYPEQSMTREETLQSYTLNNAYAAFEEDIKGSIEVGKLADVVVLDRNIMQVDVEEIKGTLVDYTIIGGEVLYTRM